MHLDPGIPSEPPRLPHLAPSHAASMHRCGYDVRVIRVWSTAPNSWVRGPHTGQCKSRDVQSRARHGAVTREGQGAKRMNECTKIYRWPCLAWARGRWQRVRVMRTRSREMRPHVDMLVLVLMLVLVCMTVRTRVRVAVAVAMRMRVHTCWR